MTLTGLDSVPREQRRAGRLDRARGRRLTIIAYAGAVIVEAIAGGVLTGALAERRRERTIHQLRDHFIICGYGRVGRRVAEEFRAAGVPFVVLDFNEDAVAAAQEHGDLLVEGDATHDENLRRAGLDRAQGLVAASDSDADNLYITLSARSVRPDLTIVARASGARTRRRSWRSPAPTGSCSRTRPRGARWRISCSSRRSRRSSTSSRPRPGPTSSSRRSRCAGHAAAAGRTIRELRIRHETGAIVIALRKPDGTFDTTPGARHADRGRRRADRRRLAGRDPGARRPLRPQRDRCRLIPSGRSRPRSPSRPEPSSSSSGRASRSTATTRRTSRCSSRGRGGGRRGSSRPRSRTAAAGLEAVERAEVAGPGFVNLFLRDEWFAAALGEILEDGRRVRRRSSAEPRERIQVEMVSANPTGPITVASARNGAYGDSARPAARVRGPRGRARVLLQRLGRADRPLPRVGRGRPAGRGAARGRLPGRVRPRPRRLAGRPGAADAEADRGDARAVPRSTSTASACRASSSSGCPSSCRSSTRTRRTGRSGRARRRTATTRTACSSARTTARRPTAPPTSRISWTSSSAASTARSTSSAPTITARATGTRRSRGCSATTPSASRSSSTSSST